MSIIHDAFERRQAERRDAAGPEDNQRDPAPHAKDDDAAAPDTPSPSAGGDHLEDTPRAMTEDTSNEFDDFEFDAPDSKEGADLDALFEEDAATPPTPESGGGEADDLDALLGDEAAGGTPSGDAELDALLGEDAAAVPHSGESDTAGDDLDALIEDLESIAEQEDTQPPITPLPAAAPPETPAEAPPLLEPDSIESGDPAMDSLFAPTGNPPGKEVVEDAEIADDAPAPAPLDDGNEGDDLDALLDADLDLRKSGPTEVLSADAVEADAVEAEAVDAEAEAEADMDATETFAPFEESAEDAADPFEDDAEADAEGADVVATLEDGDDGDDFLPPLDAGQDAEDIFNAAEAPDLGSADFAEVVEDADVREAGAVVKESVFGEGAGPSADEEVLPPDFDEPVDLASEAAPLQEFAAVGTPAAPPRAGIAARAGLAVLSLALIATISWAVTTFRQLGSSPTQVAAVPATPAAAPTAPQPTVVPPPAAPAEPAPVPVAAVPAPAAEPAPVMAPDAEPVSVEEVTATELATAAPVVAARAEPAIPSAEPTDIEPDVPVAVAALPTEPELPVVEPPATEAPVVEAPPAEIPAAAPVEAEPTPADMAPTPVVAQAPPADPVETLRESLKIHAIRYSPDDPRAIVNLRRVFEGDTVAGARIVKIQPDRILFESGGTQFTLRF